MLCRRHRRAGRAPDLEVADMTADQFVSWLEGYLDRNGTAPLVHSDLEQIRAKIREVNPAPTTQPPHPILGIRAPSPEPFGSGVMLFNHDPSTHLCGAGDIAKAQGSPEKVTPC
jgi:hypothetical protein